MYGFDFELEPATEGIGSFFSMVLDKIKAAGEKIKDWLDKVALKIKRLTGRTSAEQSREDSAEVTKKIQSIRDGITSILDTCTAQIDILYTAFKKVADGTEITDYSKVSGNGPTGTQYMTLKDSEGKSNTKSNVILRDGKYYDVTKAYGSKNGMDRISKSVDKNSQTMRDWEDAKEKVALNLANAKGDAEKVSADLKSLASYGPLGKTATEKGYESLREIFNANGDFGAQWKKIKIAAEWSTGVIKEALNKVVSIYDVGIRATDAFGGRLARGFVREDNGERMNKEDLKAYRETNKFKNKVYASNKSDRDISVDRKSDNFFEAQLGNTNSRSSSANAPAATTRSASTNPPPSGPNPPPAGPSSAPKAQQQAVKSKNSASQQTTNRSNQTSNSGKKQSFAEGFKEFIDDPFGTVTRTVNDARKRANNARKNANATNNGRTRRRGNESVDYMIDNIYQIAYEDAMNDYMYTQEALDIYDSIPGAYEFVEESYDAYDEDFDYDPLHDMV